MEKNYDRCLAAMVFHQNTILQLPANHAARSIMLYSHSSVRNMLATHVHVMHAWETNNGLTGIPPHIKTLVDVEANEVAPEPEPIKLRSKFLLPKGQTQYIIFKTCNNVCVDRTQLAFHNKKYHTTHQHY